MSLQISALPTLQIEIIHGQFCLGCCDKNAVNISGLPHTPFYLDIYRIHWHFSCSITCIHSTEIGNIFDVSTYLCNEFNIKVTTVTHKEC